MRSQNEEDSPQIEIDKRDKKAIVEFLNKLLSDRLEERRILGRHKVEIDEENGNIYIVFAKGMKPEELQKDQEYIVNNLLEHFMHFASHGASGGVESGYREDYQLHALDRNVLEFLEKNRNERTKEKVKGLEKLYDKRRPLVKELIKEQKGNPEEEAERKLDLLIKLNENLLGPKILQHIEQCRQSKFLEQLKQINKDPKYEAERGKSPFYSNILMEIPKIPVKLPGIDKLPLSEIYDLSEVLQFQRNSTGQLIHPEYPKLMISLDQIIPVPVGQLDQEIMRIIGAVKEEKKAQPSAARQPDAQPQRAVPSGNPPGGPAMVHDVPGPSAAVRGESAVPDRKPVRASSPTNNALILLHYRQIMEIMEIKYSDDKYDGVRKIIEREGPVLSRPASVGKVLKEIEGVLQISIGEFIEQANFRSELKPLYGDVEKFALAVENKYDEFGGERLRVALKPLETSDPQVYKQAMAAIQMLQEVDNDIRLELKALYKNFEKFTLAVGKIFEERGGERLRVALKPLETSDPQVYKRAMLAIQVLEKPEKAVDAKQAPPHRREPAARSEPPSKGPVRRM